MAAGPETQRNFKRGLAAAVIASALFSAKSVFFKLCYRHGTPPVVLQAWRGIFSLPFFVWPLIAGMAARRAGRAPALVRKDFLILAALGLSGFYLASLFDMLGLQYVSAGTERLILYVYPTLVILFSAAIFRKPIARSLYVPLALSYAGIAFSFGGEASLGGSRAAYGGSLVLLSAVFYAMFLVWQGKLVHRYGSQFFAAACMLVSFIAYVVQFLILYPVSALAQPRPVLWLAAFTAVFCNVAPTYLFAYAIKLAGAGPTSVAGTIGPVSTLLLSSWLLGENPGWHQLAGLALVVTGALRLASGKPAGTQGSGGRGSPSAGDGGPPFADGRNGGSGSPAIGGKATANGSRPAAGPAELSDPAASAAAFLDSAKGRGSADSILGRNHSRIA